ncbi:PREDICTED: CD81 antigen [Hipposideros armiger]|uniref:CD81 antigen n=1 Tax=Hipposideros armiger TaxID=186990 RepID=A0A8B7TAW5_HIPAR|nr:PREDICTED: CD81 antigen [Hipposideros armiger]
MAASSEEQDSPGSRPAPTLPAFLGHTSRGPCSPLLAGGVILGVALWLRHDPQTTSLLYLELGDKPAPNTFYVGIYILIAVGAVMMFVGFLGCYGAIQESQCLLGTVGRPPAGRPPQADCHQKIDELFSGKLYLIGIAAIVVAVIMIFEMILSMVLCCGIRNSSVY